MIFGARKHLRHWAREPYTISVEGKSETTEHLVRGYVSPGRLFGLHKHGKFSRWTGLGDWRITHLLTGLRLLPHVRIESLPVARDTILGLERYPDIWRTHDAEKIRAVGQTHFSASFIVEALTSRMRRSTTPPEGEQPCDP